MKKETFITVFYRKRGAQTPDCIPPTPVWAGEGGGGDQLVAGQGQEVLNPRVCGLLQARVSLIYLIERN